MNDKTDKAVPAQTPESAPSDESKANSAPETSDEQQPADDMPKVASLAGDAIAEHRSHAAPADVIERIGQGVQTARLHELQLDDVGAVGL